MLAWWVFQHRQLTWSSPSSNFLLRHSSNLQIRSWRTFYFQKFSLIICKQSLNNIFVIQIDPLHRMHSTNSNYYISYHPYLKTMGLAILIVIAKKYNSFFWDQNPIFGVILFYVCYLNNLVLVNNYLIKTYFSEKLLCLVAYYCRFQYQNGSYIFRNKAILILLLMLASKLLKPTASFLWQ